MSLLSLEIGNPYNVGTIGMMFDFYRFMLEVRGMMDGND
jgi:hypothetical protein